MHRHRHRLVSVVFGSALWLAAGCDPGYGVPDANRPPIADARVRGQDGREVVLESTGEPVSVSLDGSRSSDRDGKIVRYRWLSATRRPPAAASGGAGAAGTEMPDAGTPEFMLMEDRWVPEGEQPNWPEDVRRPEVVLDRGAYAFTLWVIDDDGAVSAPNTVKVAIGDQP